DGLPRQGGHVADEELMRQAIDVARSTPPGDVPVGALVVDADGHVLATATNRREQDADPLAHAEVLALRDAASKLGDSWRLERCTLIVTLEPCAMCAGAALGARVGRIVFGAYEPRTGACGSVWDLPREAPLHKAEVRGGVLQPECEQLLRGLFEKLREPSAAAGTTGTGRRRTRWPAFWGAGAVLLLLLKVFMATMP